MCQAVGVPEKKGKVEQGEWSSFHPVATGPLSSLASPSEDGQEVIDGKALHLTQQEAEHASYLQRFRFGAFASLSETGIWADGHRVEGCSSFVIAKSIEL